MRVRCRATCAPEKSVLTACVFLRLAVAEAMDEIPIRKVLGVIGGNEAAHSARELLSFTKKSAVPRARLEHRVAVLGRAAQEARKAVDALQATGAGAASPRKWQAGQPPISKKQRAAPPGPARFAPPSGVALPRPVSDDLPPPPPASPPPIDVKLAALEREEKAAREEYGRLWRLCAGSTAPAHIHDQLQHAEQRVRQANAALSMYQNEIM